MRKKIVLIVITIFVVIIGGVTLKRLIDEGEVDVTFGEPQHDFPILSQGSYTVEQIGLESGEYTIYALSGYGTITIDTVEYPLDELLFNDVLERAEPVKFTILYREGLKVMLQEATTITVNGDENFKISFLKR